MTVLEHHRRFPVGRFQERSRRADREGYEERRSHPKGIAPLHRRVEEYPLRKETVTATNGERSERRTSNVTTTPPALDAYISKKSLKLFEEVGIFSHREAEARHEIMLETYQEDPDRGAGYWRSAINHTAGGGEVPDDPG